MRRGARWFFFSWRRWGGLKVSSSSVVAIFLPFTTSCICNLSGLQQSFLIPRSKLNLGRVRASTSMSRLPSGTAPAGRSYVAEPTWAANPDFKPHHHSISPVRPGRTTQATAPAPSRKSPIRQHQVADGDPTSQSAASPADAARASNAVMREVSEVPVYSRNPTPQGAASSPSRQAQQVQLQSNKFAEMAFYDQEELSFWQTRCTSLHLYGLQRWLLYDRSKVGRILPLTVSTMGFMTLAHSQIRAWIGQAVSAFKPTVPVVINCSYSVTASPSDYTPHPCASSLTDVSLLCSTGLLFV